MYGFMHLVMYTGFYRVLPTKDFTWEISIGYFCELVFYLIPTVLCQVYNNSGVSTFYNDLETETRLTTLQSFSLAVKCLQIVTFILESCLMCWELYHNNQMRQMKIGSYKELTEVERRAKYSTQVRNLGCCSIIGVILVLVLGMAIGTSRECPAMHALESAVCRSCVD